MSSTYVARTPGLKCQICGADISNRAKGTQHCSKCQHEIDVENAIKRKERKKLLEARDTAIPPTYKSIKYQMGWLECTLCGCEEINERDKFCRKCGQRLKGG